MVVPRVSIVYQISLSPRLSSQTLALARRERLRRTSSQNIPVESPCLICVPLPVMTLAAGCRICLVVPLIYGGLVWTWTCRMHRYFHHIHVLTLDDWVRWSDAMLFFYARRLPSDSLTYPLPSLIFVFDILITENKHLTIYLEQQTFRLAFYPYLYPFIYYFKKEGLLQIQLKIKGRRQSLK